ncbi:putative 3-hydroxyacyl-CoA dehydrogenase B0272.3 [Dermatophagoides pteronyssinus]|uniref:Probable 3-hydroxyacyl-CoA dehydrogenase B0272.3 n=1 Tax=Dermatophagoides pteronyssinus TaxID=6956 RepID=A0A6P6Y4K6_DERPT|nr:probable 3-hydroxyacyl-CoA dehydrogenase B0272.3 [Dermatophagoides pteronyssinus]
MISKQILLFRSINQLRHVRFFSQTAYLKRIENVMIIGSGLMGSGIAQSCITTGRFNSVTLQDVSDKQLEKARKNIQQSLSKLKAKKKINIDDAEMVTNKINFSVEMKPANDENLLIIEAVPELLEIKQNLFKNLCEQFKSNDTIIYATNTSSLPCYEIGKYITCPERFAGLHFFNPVPLMKLVEIARTDNGTSDDTFEKLRQFVQDIDKVSVACKDTPGFIVNRLFFPYKQECIKMVERGDATIEDIDTAMKLGAGYPMGPFELWDLTGLDTTKFIMDAWEKRGDPTLTMHKSPIIEEMVAKGHLGRKTGKGFYDYSSDKKK